jgi:hypothetical protein
MVTRPDRNLPAWSCCAARTVKSDIAGRAAHRTLQGASEPAVQVITWERGMIYRAKEIERLLAFQDRSFLGINEENINYVF